MEYLRHIRTRRFRRIHSSSCGSLVWRNPVCIHAFGDACHAVGSEFSDEQWQIQVDTRNGALKISNRISRRMMNGIELRCAATIKPHLLVQGMGLSSPQRFMQVQRVALVPALTWSCSEKTCILHTCSAQVVSITFTLHKPATCSVPLQATSSLVLLFLSYTLTHLYQSTFYHMALSLFHLALPFSSPCLLASPPFFFPESCLTSS